MSSLGTNRAAAIFFKEKRYKEGKRGEIFVHGRYSRHSRCWRGAGLKATESPMQCSCEKNGSEKKEKKGKNTP